MATEMPTAMIINATVWRLSSHRPMAPKYMTPSAASSPALMLSADAATMAAAAVTTNQGSHSRKRSTVRRPQSMESLIGLKMKEKLQWVVWLLMIQRRASSIQSARPMAHDSGNPPTALSASWAATTRATPSTSSLPERVRRRRSSASRASTASAALSGPVAGAVAVTAVQQLVRL